MTLRRWMGTLAGGSASLLTAARQRFRRPPAGTLILLYHRIAAVEVDPWGLAVTPEHFSEHLEVLRRIADPVPLARVCGSNTTRTPRVTIALTFDDGYADNLHAAIPILERFDVPATFFVTAGLVERSGEFWWDQLSRLVLAAAGPPPALQLHTGTGLFHAEGSLQATGSSPRVDDGPAPAGWRAWEIAQTPRQALYQRLYALFRDAREEDRCRMLEELVVQSGASTAVPASHRVLDAAELAALARHPLAEIGAHTLAHNALAGLSPAAQHSEIVGGKAVLERCTGQPVSSFAYPFGQPGDFTAETTALVRNAGYARACAVMPRLVENDCDPFTLPRLGIPDGDGGDFERMVNALLLDNDPPTE